MNLQRSQQQQPQSKKFLCLFLHRKKSRCNYLLDIILISFCKVTFERVEVLAAAATTKNVLLFQVCQIDAAIYKLMP